MPTSFPLVTAVHVREELLAKRELALLDAREEALHATGHPLFAANLPLSRAELEAYIRLPRRDVSIVVFDDGECVALRLAGVLRDLGYTQVQLLDGGLRAWRDAGFEIFIDVNSASKAFGELVEAKRHTPSLSAQQVQSMIEAKADMVILDVRRFDEYQTMSIPTGVSVPGAELVLRIRDMAPRQETQVVINCAGRTRSIIGTQSLLNAGIPNNVAALRNGTIGWKLANQTLAHGASQRFRPPSDEAQKLAAARARTVADKAGVQRITLAEMEELLEAGDATVYRYDVCTPEEFAAGHLPGFRNAPGGQLVQETDMFCPVRGARIILCDNDGARANMTASWLRQMDWNAAVLDGLVVTDFSAAGKAAAKTASLPELDSSAVLAAEAARAHLRDPRTALLDFATERQYRETHIPGAWYAQRSCLKEALATTFWAQSYMLTSPDGFKAHFAFRDLQARTSKPIYLLRGGTEAWQTHGLSLTADQPRFASVPTDHYRRPYEGTDSSTAAMQAYLDWESGLVAQLDKDGTHGFWVL